MNTSEEVINTNTMNTRTDRKPHIVIINDIDVFGYKIKSSELDNRISREIYIRDKDLIILGIYNDEDGNMAHLPIHPFTFGKTQIEFLDEICRLNTGHSSYEEYKKSLCN
jgi:hypothetical protein